MIGKIVHVFDNTMWQGSSKLGKIVKFDEDVLEIECLDGTKLFWSPANFGLSYVNILDDVNKCPCCGD